MAMAEGRGFDWKGLSDRTSGPCPAPGELAGFVADGLGPADRDRVLDHLAACVVCRADVIAARTMSDDATPAPAALRIRLYGLVHPRPALLPRLAVAAAALFVVVIGAILLWPLPSVETPVVRQPSPPKPVLSLTQSPEPKLVPPPLQAPMTPPVKAGSAPPPPSPLPANRVDPARPMPIPPKRPEPPSPAPVGEPPVVAVKPDLPPPPPTRPTLRGRLTAVVGALGTRSDGDRAFEAVKQGQGRDFAGTVSVKAEVSAVKARVGTTTVFLRPRTEAELTLFEGETFVRLSAGEAAFDVTPGRGAFVLETPHGRVRVTGTRFRVALEKAATEVAVLRGSVEFRAQDQAVSLSAGEESAAPAGGAPKAPMRLDARAFQWVRALEDTLLLEAEAFALQGGMAPMADTSASGGRSIGGKGSATGGRLPTAEARLRVKQPVPYAVWIRVLWGHNVPSVLSIQIHDHPAWDGRSVPSNPAWQWVRLGVFELPVEPFRVRMVDPRGDARIDQVLLTTDLDDTPETDRR